MRPLTAYCGLVQPRMRSRPGSNFQCFERPITLPDFAAEAHCFARYKEHVDAAGGEQLGGRMLPGGGVCLHRFDTHRYRTEPKGAGVFREFLQ
jgi:hypothetical protein